MNVGHRRAAVIAAGTALLLAAAAVSLVAALRDPARETSFTPVRLDANRAFPMDTLGDVRVRADAIVLATLIAEEEVSDPEIVARGEGLLGRRVTLRVDRTLWLRRGTPAPEATIQTGGGSWRYSEGSRTPFVIFGEVGRQYLYVLGYNDDPADTNSYRWGNEITLGVPILSGRTPTLINSDKPYFASIRNKTPDELQSLFASALGAGG